jgi:ribonuclease T2
VSLHPPLSLCAALATLVFAASSALAEDKAGEFDFYVLSLSWSPTYCATGNNPDPASCARRPHGFEVHGLWPEYEHGFPQDCASSEPRWLDSRIHDHVADIMPSLGLAGYEWRKHGICAGLGQSAYFALLRRAYEAVVIPSDLAAPATDVHLSPKKVEEAFIAANPGMPPAGIAVTCKRGMLDEVRVCLTKSLAPRPCPDVDRDACALPSIGVPAVR